MMMTLITNHDQSAAITLPKYAINSSAPEKKQKMDGTECSQLINRNKKLELMLMRRAKAYSSSCSQTVSHFVAVHSWIVRCSQRSQKSIKTASALILEVQGLSKSSMLIPLKSSTLVIVLIDSMPMVMSNCFHERLANSAKITTFTGISLFDTFVRRFP